MRRTSPAARRRLAVLAAGVIFATVAIALLLARGDRPPGDLPVVPTPPGSAGAHAEPLPDPFAWDPDRAEEFERRAAAGASQPLYAFSPGGAEASAARTARWRKPIERTAAAAGVDADTFEGLVLLESAGREDALTPAGIEGAAGLAQIVAETGRNLLGMRVEERPSARYTRRIARELRRGRLDRVQALRVARRKVDERFDPAKALAGSARYLTFARRRLGREDLAFVSYHMGVGNLENVLKAYGKADGDLGYTQLYFDSTPASHPVAYDRLRRLGDDSANYWWKVAAAREIMSLWREDPERLAALATLHTAKNSAEEVLHPPGSVPRFADPVALREAFDDGDVVAFPDAPAVTGLRADARMGELAGRLKQPRGLYRALRPEALALALYVGAQVRQLSGQAPLDVTSTVRDETYQRLLVRRNREATANYSLHTTGWAFDVARRYRSGRQALAFQFVLDRLQVLNVIAWVREPDAIHVTASGDAADLLPLLDRIQPGP